MPKGNLRIAGARPLDRKLRELPGEIRREAEHLARKQMRKVERRAKELAPVASGRTRDAIGLTVVSTSPHSVVILVSLSPRDYVGEAFYGAMQEFGTRNPDGSRRIEPVRFLRGAASETRRDVAREVEQGLASMIKSMPSVTG